MQRYLVIRLGEGALTLFAVSLVIFILTHLSGDPVSVMLPPEAGPGARERLTHLWGLDRPWPEQYMVLLANALRGNFGESFHWSGQTAMGLVLSRLPATLQLASFALTLSVLIAIPLGVASAVNRDSAVDRLGKIVALLGQSLPTFLTGLVLIWVFAATLHWFPTFGIGGWNNLILPGITLGLFPVAAFARLTRSAMLSALDSEYIKLAQLNGVPGWKIIWKHAFKNAAIVPLTYFGLVLGSLITGSVTIETVFSWPGVGSLALDAVLARDYQVVQAVTICISAVFVTVNLIVDVMYAYLDPRVRYS
jgi:peptide/nickel transport system permease protein